MSTATIPFAARAAAAPPLVTTSTTGVTYDKARQLNIAADGKPWHTKAQAASSTDTNSDGQGDDVTDPYFAPAS
ncbi:putative ATP-grasp-modified RiPP [Streptomyces aureus]|uniref:putative ATP-grasp-modified RiPP n=1 Tax=Streptomyces aureus TaxID=193461 RepID=UPI0036BE698C